MQNIYLCLRYSPNTVAGCSTYAMKYMAAELKEASASSIKRSLSYRKSVLLNGYVDADFFQVVTFSIRQVRLE